MDIERRAFVIDGLQVEEREGVAPMIRGHAAVFNQLSEDLGGFREQIAPGAFADALGTDDVRALFNHDPNFVLGRNLAGTLKLSEDARGLAIEIDPPDTQFARDLMVSMKRGDINQMSFGFSVRPNGQNWAKDDDGKVIRTLTKLRLFDVSPVTFPAYPQTDVAVRSLEQWKTETGNNGEGKPVNNRDCKKLETNLLLLDNE
jgi:HK97 family phage prohead protease